MSARKLMGRLIALTAACTWLAPLEAAAPVPGRIHSTLGFSFEPPPGRDWTEEFGNSQVEYLKKTDPSVMTFYAGILELHLPAPLPDKKSLAAFVRTKKDEWGRDGRFTHVSTSFLLEERQSACVRYRISARDHGAKNKGFRTYLLLQAAGRFCTHPQNPGVAVDIYYSIRHLPANDASAFSKEGDAFLDSLGIDKPRATQDLSP